MANQTRFVVKVATGSSYELLSDRLNANRHFEWAVNDNFVIFLHQGPSHIHLMQDQGLNEYDVMFLGNASVFRLDNRLCIRAKSQRNLPPFLKGDRTDEEIQRIILDLLDEIDYAIGEFIKELWRQPEPLVVDYIVRNNLPAY